MFKKIFTPLFLMCFLFALQIKASVPSVTITEDETITTIHKKTALEEFKSLSKKEKKQE